MAHKIPRKCNLHYVYSLFLKINKLIQALTKVLLLLFTTHTCLFLKLCIHLLLLLESEVAYHNVHGNLVIFDCLDNSTQELVSNTTFVSHFFDL